MSDGLQFNDARERHFAADFADRYFINNRKGLVIVSLSLTFWLLWLERSLDTPINFLSTATMVAAISSGILLAALSLLKWVKLRLSLLIGFFVLTVQAAMIVVSLDPALRGSLPQLLFPLLLPGLLFRLRFVYVLPFSLLVWILQFFSINFVTHASFFVYGQWAQMTTLLLITNLVVSFQVERESRRAFAALFPLHAMSPGRHEQVS